MIRMVANYPYFGLPNYMRYMNPNVYRNMPQQNQEYIRNNSRAQPRNRNSYYSTPYTQNNRQISQAPMNSRNNLNYRPSSYNVHSKTSPKQINTDYNLCKGKSSSYKKNITQPKKEKANQQELPPLFSFFGINLYFDDVLILCILFFLYNEKVNDPYLFFTLVLLLLT